MLGINTEIHIQNPNSPGKRDLVRGVISDQQDGGFVAEFEQARFPVTVDQKIVLFYESRRKFMQQSARVMEVHGVSGVLTFAFEAVGKPVSAEDREHYRTPAVSAVIDIRVGGEDGCRMVDISATGFAYIGRNEHAIGTILEVSVNHDDVEYSGTMSIQSVRNLGILGIRHGLRYLDDGASAGTLKGGLQGISLKLERAMLQRKSGLD